jgi:hypothetical protein
MSFDLAGLMTINLSDDIAKHATVLTRRQRSASGP